MPRSRDQDNPIDKAFTVMAEMIVKMMPIDSQQKKAYVYYRDGLSAQNDGDYSEALENYEESLRLEENPIDRSETLKNMAIIYMSNGDEERALNTYMKYLNENIHSYSKNIVKEENDNSRFYYIFSNFKGSPEKINKLRSLIINQG